MQYPDVFGCFSVCTGVSVCLDMFIPLFPQPLCSVNRSQARYWAALEGWGPSPHAHSPVGGGQ